MPGPDLQGFAARLTNGPAFLLLGCAQNGDGDQSALYRWSGVYTSRTDAAAASRFRAEWRTVRPLGAMVSTPSRSQTDLEVRYLFGGDDLPEGERPPIDELQLADARVQCIQELTRLVNETITPRGLIVVEGWAPGDVLAASDLVPALRALGPGQIHLFSSGAWATDPFVASMVTTGQIVMHPESLDEAIGRLAETGAVRVGGSDGFAGGSRHVVALGDGFVEIDIHTWNEVRSSARPVDLELLTPPVFSSPAARYQEFRSFVGATEGTPQWRGIAAGLNIRREFEDRLATAVDAALADPDLLRPVVVWGQTATGKSVALAALAMELARGGAYAVLYQSRRTVRPSFESLDMYAAWAEDRGAEATVLVWDGMTDPDDYAALLRQLRSRGRKVLIVGSAYARKHDSHRLDLDAPAELTKGELKALVELLGSIGIPFEPPKGALDTSFIAFLYHMLPDSHDSLRSGLAEELRATERGIEKLVRERGAQRSQRERITAMAAALEAAGVRLDELLPVPELQDDEKPLIEQTFAARRPVQQVTALVLAATRHGVPVPIDLALRVLGREGSQQIRDVLNSFDIIREIEDDNGEYFLTMRSNLEAELLAQREMSLEVEIDIITTIMRNVRVTEGFTPGANEVTFAVSLLERLGPKSGDRYKPYYGDISTALADRRLETGHSHPRLVLQESKFLRDHVHWRQKRGDGSPEERITDLEYNRDLLEDTLSGGVQGLMRLSLAVELASTLGAIIHEISEQGGAVAPVSILGQLDDIYHAVIQARTVDPGSPHAVDVLAWSTRDAILTGALSVHDRLDRLTSAVAMLDSIDATQLSEEQQANADNRKRELNQLLRNDDAVWENLRSLERNADPAAVYLLAKLEAQDGPTGEAKALARLRSAPPEARRDWRCAQMLLDLTWKEITGGHLLRGPRTPVLLSDDKIDTLLGLAVDARDVELPDRYKMAFVEAFALFAAGRYSDASRLFREVERLTRQLPRRIYTTVVLGTETRSPRIFTGRVEWATERDGEVWVDELRTKVHFEPWQFAKGQSLAKGQPLPAFMIGFKLTRGPVAEPRTLYFAEPRPR